MHLMRWVLRCGSPIPGLALIVYGLPGYSASVVGECSLPPSGNQHEMDGVTQSLQNLKLAEVFQAPDQSPLRRIAQKGSETFSFSPGRVETCLSPQNLPSNTSWLSSPLQTQGRRVPITWVGIEKQFSSPPEIGATDPLGLLAQKPDPNRDRLLPGAPNPTEPVPTQPILPVPPTPSPSPSPVPSPEATPNPAIAVTKIEVTGSTILGAKEIEPIIKPLEGRSVTLDELRNAADAITQIYLDRGYITSRAILVDQVIENGVVQIRVVEGSVEQIDVEGTRRLHPSYVRSRVALGAGTPLRQDRLEDQLRLLKADPLFANVEASLRPGTQLGKSILTVRVTEAQSFYGVIGADNYSPPSVGAVRLGGIVGYRNPTGFGDEISVSYFGTTTGGSNQYDFNYRVPLNAMNGTLQLRAAPSNNRITDDQFGFLDISGETELYEVSFRQPLVRSPREELALSLGFSYQNGQTFIFNGQPFPFGIGPDVDGNSRVRVLKFGQDYVKRDLQGAWALRSQFSFGVNVFDATTNDAPIPDGRFFSWLAQLQRVQRINEDNLLIAQFDVQLTPDSLLPSQQFVIGGGQSVRGYRQNARSGDNGIRLSLEDRIVVYRDQAGIPVLQFAPFFDAGLIWNQADNPNELPEQTFLAAVGLGILFQPLPQFSVRLDYAPPLINLDDRGGNAQDDGFYFSVNYQF